ncbi:MAG: polysaccharide biosynthesis C-terminal domain-containing protein [Bacteroidota bacterium]
MLKKIIVTLFTRGFVALVNLAILLISSKQLGGDIRGQISLLILNIAIIQVINEIYTGYVLVYFIPKYALRKIYTTGIIWSVVCIGITTVILIALNMYFDVEISRYWIHIAVLSFIIILHSFNGVVILAKEKIKTYNFLNFFQPSLLLIVLAFQIFVFDLKTIDSYIVALYVSFLCSLFISGTQVIGIFKNIKQSLPVCETGEIFKKGFFNQLANLSHMLSNRYNFYLLSNNVLVGIYSSATSLIESVLIISNSAATIILTYIANQKNDSHSIKITFLLSKLCFLLSLVCVLVLLIIPAELFTFLLGKDFSETKQVMLCLSPGILCISFSTVISHYFSGLGKQRLIAIANFSGLFTTVITGYFLVNKFELYGACYATCLSYFVASLIMVTVFMREHNLSLWSLFRIRSDFKLLKTIS